MMELDFSTTISARTMFSGCVRIVRPIAFTDEELKAGIENMENVWRVIA